VNIRGNTKFIWEDEIVEYREHHLGSGTGLLAHDAPWREIICPTYTDKPISFRGQWIMQKAVALENNYYDPETDKFTGGFNPVEYMDDQPQEYQKAYAAAAHPETGTIFLTDANRLLTKRIGEWQQERENMRIKD